MNDTVSWVEFVKYLRHLTGCQLSLRTTGNPICTCGLSALLDRAEGRA